MKAKDIALRPKPDGACRVDFSDDGAKAAFHKWAKARAEAKDGLVTTSVLSLLALYGLWKWLRSEPVDRYDFSKYQR